MNRRSVATVYVRHQGNCKYAGRADRSFARDCQCIKWLRFSVSGKQSRISSESRTWAVAEEKCRALQGRLDGGEAIAPPKQAQRTIRQAIETLLTAKRSEGCTKRTVQSLECQLGRFEAFMSARSRFFPADITPHDLVEFRASWTDLSGLTRKQKQQSLRGFLKSCCTSNLPALLGVLKTMRLSKTDVARLEPRPFTEPEVERLMAQVQILYGHEPDRAARLTALMHLQISTGMAIHDTVNLERSSIDGGWLRIRRQKTNRPVEQKLTDELYAELLAVSIRDTHVFYNGLTQIHSAVDAYMECIRAVMQAAGLWIKGNLSHRFRDTAVDYWIGKGCSLLEIASLLGDTVPTVERHYRSLLSVRLKARLEKIPARVW